ncbi:SusC/RagA family TonB-linked outer membrane protein [Deminuibacter soli]|nr:SusC/RagA family TonB-linked outer membrane protein [Deminuibacter soli]
MLVLCFGLTTLWAQNKTVSGTVKDEKGSPIQGASVAVKGTTRGTTTNATGSFTISVKPGTTTLVVSYVGYTSQEIDISSSATADVSLKPETGSLNDIIVIGYGTVRKKDLTGSVASVGAKDFNKGTFTAPDQLIQGKVAGVQVLNNSGQPGGATTVKIRGSSALTGTGSPLYVVDGIPLDGRSARPALNATGLGNSPAGNPLNFLNPADIASIDVLKDASGTAIYGSRGAYGVVLITTKKGTNGQPRLDLGASVGTSHIMKQIDILDAGEYRAALKSYNLDATNRDFGGDVNAMDAILRNATTQNYSLAVSGGNENGHYRLSTNLLDQQGIVKKTDFKKYSVGLNAGFKFLENKRLGLDFYVVASQYLENLAPITNDAGSTGSLIGQALQWNPTKPLRLANDSLNISGAIVNPLAMSEAYNDRSKVTSILGAISPYYKITNDLEYRMLYSINYSTGIRRSMINEFINLTDYTGKGAAYYGNNELITQQITHTLNYNKQISKNFSLNALLGIEYLKFVNKGATIKAFGPAGGFGNYGLDYTDYLQYSDPASRSITSFVDPKTALMSYFGRVVLNYRDRYVFTGTLREDGSTKFGADNKHGYFPSFAAAWNINREEFFKSNTITNLKLRGSWGKTGNQEFPSGSSLRKYSFTDNGGTAQVNNQNDSLKWQSDEQYNIGIDLGILKNRITITADYFHKKTTGLLFPTTPIFPAPPTSAVTWKNLDGQVINKGFEVNVNASVIEGKAFYWSVGANASFIKNMVSGLPAPIFTGNLSGQGVSGTQVEVIANGLPINAFWTRAYGGLDKATGQSIYPDGDVPSYQGNPNPRTLLGFSTTVGYKKLSFTANLNGALGKDVYNNTFNNVVNIGNLNKGLNVAKVFVESPVQEAFSNRVTSSARFIENGSYMKFANATLNYNLGNVANVFKNINFYVTGSNLFVITKFKGFDPEVNVDKNQNGVPSAGIEYTPYPTARTFTLGVNFSL